MNRVTPSLVVCVAAGLFVAGSLAVNSGNPPGAPATPASTSVTPNVAPDGGAVGSNAPQGRGTAAATTSDGVITISGFAFTAATVRPGQRVAVVNRDGTAHTATAVGGGFDSGVVDAGATGSFTAPSAPGTYRFVCRIHPDMSGELVVR